MLTKNVPDLEGTQVHENFVSERIKERVSNWMDLVQGRVK
jgi:hypothetical protein